MNTELLKQKLIAELNENSILLYAERQKFKENHLPKELLEEMLIKYKRKKKFNSIAFIVILIVIVLMLSLARFNESPNNILLQMGFQFMPVLGGLFFSAQTMNFSKKIFILDLLLDWEE